MTIETTCTWIVEWMSTQKVDGDLQNVVIQAGWRANGYRAVNSSTYQTTVYGSVGFTSPDPTSFTPYDELSSEQVLEWIWTNGVNKDTTEEGINKQLDQLINPPVVQLPLPWTQTTNNP